MMDLNKLSAKLAKAEMLNQNNLIEKYRKEIEQFKREQVKNSSSTPSSTSSPANFEGSKRVKKADLLNELNKLNSKLTKAEFLCQDEQVERYKKEIKELKQKYDQCDDDIIRCSDRKSNQKVFTDKMNKLGSKLTKAELLNQTDLIAQYKNEIEQLKKGFESDSFLSNSTKTESKTDIQLPTKTSKVNDKPLLNPTEYANELNRLGAKMARAEMLNQVDVVDQLQQEIDLLKRRHGHDTELIEEVAEEPESIDRYQDSMYSSHKRKNANDSKESSSQSDGRGPSRQPFYLKKSALDQSEDKSAKGSGMSKKIIEFTKKVNENNMSLRQMVISTFYKRNYNLFKLNSIKI